MVCGVWCIQIATYPWYAESKRPTSYPGDWTVVHGNHVWLRYSKTSDNVAPTVKTMCHSEERAAICLWLHADVPEVLMKTPGRENVMMLEWVWDWKQADENRFDAVYLRLPLRPQWINSISPRQQHLSVILIKCSQDYRRCSPLLCEILHPVCPVEMTLILDKHM